MQDEPRPWVAYVGPFAYPDGGAAARRVRGMAESLVLGGFDVVVASGASDAVADAGSDIPQAPGLAYRHVGERVAEHWPRPVRRLRYAWMGRRTLQWLASRPRPPAAVILYSGYTPYLQRLLPWCRARGIPLLFDAVEWYEPERRAGYFTSPYQWNIEWAMRRLIPETNGVIAISRYLGDYYRARGLPVAIVPPTTSAIGAGDWAPDPTLRLCYAGSPGANKDNLDIVLRAAQAMAARGAPIALSVAGPTPGEVAARLGRGDPGGLPWLRSLGNLPQGEVRDLVGRSDFTVLVRADRRQSNAGFPTKFVESFAAGTPVIGNLTSDLGDHLRDGDTGIVCGGDSFDAVLEALLRAAEVGPARLGGMRAACLAHAQASFAPSVHVEPLRGLLAACGVRLPPHG